MKVFKVIKFNNIGVVANKIKLVPILCGLGLGATIAGTLVLAGSLTHNRAIAAFDLVGVNQQLLRHEEQINNHEARIENLEKDTGKIQQETDVKPASDHQAVPPVTTLTPSQQTAPTPPQQPVEQPKPPVIVKSASVRTEQISDRQHPDIYKKTYFCDLLFSDGTSGSVVGQIEYVGSVLSIGGFWPCSRLVGQPKAGNIGSNLVH